MTRRGFFCVLILAFVLLAGPAPGEETEIPADIPLPEGTLGKAELLELLTDKTVYSVTAVQRRESVSYFDPSGELRQLRNGIKRIGRWRVTDNGRICLQMEELPEKCRIIVREQGTYKKYIVKKNGQHQHSVSYPAFRAGNPLGL